MQWSMVLAKVVCEVGCPWLPVHVEHALINAVSEPVKSHIDCFRSLLFDGVVQDTLRALVIRLDRCSGLWVAEEDEGLAEWTRILCVVKGSSHLSFGSRTEYIFS